MARKLGAGKEKPEGVKALSLRLPLSVWKRLKIQAIEEGRPAHDLLTDALADYLRKKGKP
jgi:predicted DNA-binding protein